MRKDVKHFLVGFFAPVILYYLGLLGASVFFGFINWENPLLFFGEEIKDMLDGNSIGYIFRVGLTISTALGVLAIYMGKYLNDE